MEKLCLMNRMASWEKVVDGLRNSCLHKLDLVAHEPIASSYRRDEFAGTVYVWEDISGDVYERFNSPSSTHSSQIQNNRSDVVEPRRQSPT